MSDPKLGVAETNVEKMYHQYEAIKKWISDNQQLLVRQGTRLEDKVKTHVAMATSVERQSDGLQRNNWSNGQNNKATTVVGRIDGIMDDSSKETIHRVRIPILTEINRPLHALCATWSKRVAYNNHTSIELSQTSMTK